jgi:hypothetical protein
VQLQIHGGVKKTGKLNLVDLAGSENVGKCTEGAACSSALLTTALA